MTLCVPFSATFMKKILIPFLITANLAATVFAVDFPMPRSDSRGSSFVNETVIPPLAAAWSYNTFAAVIAGPVAADNKVFVGNQSGAFYCFDAYTGEVLWQYSAGGKIESAASYSNGVVYFASRDGYVHALNADTGEEEWIRNLGTQIISSPVVYNGRLYIGEGAPSNDLLVLNAETGLPVGSFSTLQPIQSNPVFGSDRVFFGSNDGRLYCIYEDTLLQAWFYQTDGFFTRSSPLVYETGVFIAPGHDERKLYRVHMSNGITAGSSAELYGSANRMSSPAEYDDVVYVAVSTSTAKIFALDANDLSNELWNYAVAGTNDGEIVPTPTITRSHLYAPDYDGGIAVLNQSDGSEVFSASVSDQPIYAQAAVSNGYVYLGLKDGYVKAYKAAQVVALNSPSNYKVVTSTGVNVYGTIILDSLIAYTVEYGAGETPSVWTVQPFIGSNFERSFIAQLDMSSLDDGVYTVRLKANNSDSLISESRFILNLPPEPPSNLTLSRVSSGLNLAWTLSPDDGGGDNDVSAYRIYRSLESGSYSSYIGSVSGGETSYIDTSLISGVTYYYVVRSYDGFSESVNSNEGLSLIHI